MKKPVIQYVLAIIIGIVSAGLNPAFAGPPASITLSAMNQTFFADSSGTWLTNGDLVEMGQFSVANATLQAMESGGNISSANYQQLLADFIPLNGVATNRMGYYSGGLFQLTAPDANSGAASIPFTGNNPGFAGGSIYLLVFNSGSASTATEVGVFTGSTWTYPTPMSGTTTIGADQASTSPLIGAYQSGIAGTLNGYNENDGNAFSTVNALELANIQPAPEPSTLALAGLGGLAMLWQFRRRK